MFRFFLAALAAFFVSSTAMAQCVNSYDDMKTLLQDQGQYPAFMGVRVSDSNVVMVFASPDTGDWTAILNVAQSRKSCVLEWGKGFTAFDPAEIKAREEGKAS